MQMLIIDRFEGDIVVVEADNNMLGCPEINFQVMCQRAIS